MTAAIVGWGWYRRPGGLAALRGSELGRQRYATENGTAFCVGSPPALAVAMPG